MLIAYMVYIRQPIHVISSGQQVPRFDEVLRHLIGALFGDLTLAAEGLIAVLIVGAMLRFRLKQNRLPLLWIGLAYILLIILAVAAGGALKWLHLTHVAVALALIIAALAAPLPRLGRWSVSVAVCALCAAQCISSLASPFRYYSAVGDALSSVTPDDAPSIFSTGRCCGRYTAQATRRMPTAFRAARRRCPTRRFSVLGADRLAACCAVCLQRCGVDRRRTAPAALPS
ncbi:MAG: hypothetical protein IPK19_20010 [Chloroflexi bacterium]|nr:hypothetical protein [Chloroflexota bacterium]